MNYHDYYDSPLGRILLTSDELGLTGLYFADKADEPTDDASEATVPESSSLTQAKQWLDIYFSGHKPDFTPPLHLTGSPFRVRVCEIMLEIPYGQTISYGEIAKRIAQERGAARMSAQAVGGAVGHNPISLIVPCHRVIGANGNLTGYGGGIDRKIALLRLEGIDTDQFSMPKPQ